LQLSLFDDRDLAEISAPDMFPGEWLIVCRNHDLAAERARKREDLLAATERELTRIDAQASRKGCALRGAAEVLGGRRGSQPEKDGQALRHHDPRWPSLLAETS